MTPFRWLATVVCALAPAGTGLAQTDQGRFSATVRDSSNAFVSEAAVTLKNERTGETRTGATNTSGFALITGLKPSSYTIRVEKTGFAAIEYTTMTIAVGQELVLDFEFKPAGVSEAVTVTAAAPMLDLSSASQGASVSQREVNGLPDGRHDGRYRHEPAGAARVPSHLLTGSRSAFGAGQCARPFLCARPDNRAVSLPSRSSRRGRAWRGRNTTEFRSG